MSVSTRTLDALTPHTHQPQPAPAVLRAPAATAPAGVDDDLARHHAALYEQYAEFVARVRTWAIEAAGSGLLTVTQANAALTAWGLHPAAAPHHDHP
jgi:hypothetical protein